MTHYDIIVSGFGPAGTVAAVKLQRLGYRVALVGELRRHAAFEGLAARTIEGLRRAGLEKAQAVAAIEAGRTASWNGATNAANREYLVDRLAFDRALLKDCRAAAIPVIRGRIGTVQYHEDGWHVTVSTTSGSEFVNAPFFVEARGRRAPRRGNIMYRGPATLSLARKFGPVAPAEPQTCLGSYPGGWYWLALPGTGAAILQIVISGNRPELAAKPSLDALFAAEVEKIPELRARLENARPQGPTVARSSEAVCSRHFAEFRSLRVGDAAFAIDPLSGHGNFEAVGGAMAAAAVINTLLNRPENRQLALDFYDQRGKSAFLRQARVGRDFYRLEQRWPNEPFWHERRDWPDDLPSHESGPNIPALKTAPVIENGFIMAREVIVTADQPRGIRIVDGVPLPEFLSALRNAGPSSAPEALAQGFNVSPAQIATALNWLGYHKLLPGQESLRSAP